MLHAPIPEALKVRHSKDRHLANGVPGRAGIVVEKPGNLRRELCVIKIDRYQQRVLSLLIDHSLRNGDFCG
jgi:hypothetical protein